MEFKPHISKKKERVVNDLVKLMSEYPVIGIIDMSNLPALQFQRIKAKLSDKLEFRLVKKRLMKIAFDKVEKKEIGKLKDKLVGIPALIFTKEDPFMLAKAIKKEVSAAPAKPGQVAPDDIILPSGPTPFTPGPMIGELGVMGIKTKVESGKISVIEDKVLVGKGEEINEKIADLMSKLGMEPMQVGFNLILTYKDGEILEKDVLFVDEKLYLDTLKQFARESDGLAMYIGYICKDTVVGMISKAYNEAETVSKLVKLDDKVEVEEIVEEKEEEKPEEKVEEQKEEIKEEPQQPKVEEEPEEKIEEVEEEPVEEKVEEEIKEEPIEEKVEEVKEEPQQEELEEVKEEPEEEGKTEEEPEKKEEIKEEEKEPEKEEPKEEKKEEPKLKNMKEETKIGMKAGKDITKEDIDLAAKQLQDIQDKMIGGKK